MFYGAERIHRRCSASSRSVRRTAGLSVGLATLGKRPPVMYGIAYI